MPCSATLEVWILSRFLLLLLLIRWETGGAKDIWAKKKRERKCCFLCLLEKVGETESEFYLFGRKTFSLQIPPGRRIAAFLHFPTEARLWGFYGRKGRKEGGDKMDE